MTRTLPIQQHIGDIKTALAISKCAVVQAPPGAGKTTRVPLALLDESWLKNKKIILLEPRRLAAVSCAAHMADLIEEKVGQTVGYQIRMDRKTGPDTRIEVVTEGIFTRKIQNDPALEDVGLVIFDEFHERNIHSDLGLALCLESFEALREDLRILVMSATMDVTAVSNLMGNAPVILSQGKEFFVETIYIPRADTHKGYAETVWASAVRRGLSEKSGDMLVFLPGVREIENLYTLLKEDPDPNLHIYPLYGNLPQKEQARAFCPSESGERKIVLATSIAETSLTIDGISIVIDSGLMRVPRFSPGTGMSRLETLPVSKAAADQRRGRAGRTKPGTCYRLWSEYEHGLLKAFTRPEILSVDLTGFALEIAAWGVPDPGQLKWLDRPEEKSFGRAKRLLQTLGALDDQGLITVHGKKMVSAGLHPRLAHMIIKGSEKGQGLLACRIAAFLNERDFLRFDQIQVESGRVDPDIRLRLELIEKEIRRQKIEERGFKINRGIIYRIMESEKKMVRDFCIKKTAPDLEKAGMLIAHAYPDRIAKKRNPENNTYLMASGKGAFFLHPNHLSTNDYIIAIHLDGSHRNAKIFLAASYSKNDLELDFSGDFKTMQTVFWDKAAGAVKAKQETRFKQLVVNEQTLPDIDPDTACDILIREIKVAGLDLLPWTKRLKSLKERALFLLNTGLFQDLPDVSDKALEKQMKTWLKPFLTGLFSLKQLEKIDLESAFLSLFTWQQQQVIKKNAPSHIMVPSGSKKLLRYKSESGILDNPVLEVRLQEMFGLGSTPKIAGRTIPITLHLLSPAGRPVQITTDLESFWNNTYKDVKKDLMGRYPKHFWPEDPISATPTTRVKPKKQ